MTTGATPVDPGLLAEAIATEVQHHPAVVRLDGGFGDLSTHLPGRRVSGVRITEVGEPVEIGVVLRLTGDLTEIARDLRTRVRRITGDVPIHVEVTDVETDGYSTVDAPRKVLPDETGNPLV